MNSHGWRWQCDGLGLFAGDQGNPEEHQTLSLCPEA